MAIPLLSEIERLINEHGSATVLKEHLSLLNTKLGLLRENMENLQKENAGLVERCAELEEQVSRQNQGGEFVEHYGALFKRRSGGGYSKTPYCPVCGRSMWCFQRVFPYEGSDDSCGHKADFKGGDLERVFAELPA
ncbi:hypothetical protein DJ031_04520 [bacterium endosymbiont of Escarpia laminata]|nr:MAG: hypothetical protein DJ031_04520 [bacterium endosymbiont of Escarpia laminata]